MDLEPLWRVLIAAGLSLPVGIERELRGKAAGLRTHVVVAVASAALGYVSIAAAGGPGNDATRIAAQVVSGIGFMGAGIIFASGGRVHGLTTAAALWSSMAIGLCVGLGGYAIAGALVVVTVLFLAPVDQVSSWLNRRFGYDERPVQFVAANVDALVQAQRALAEMHTEIRQLQLSSLGQAVAASAILRCRAPQLPEVYRCLAAVDGVEFVSEQSVHDGEA
ncbi:MAG TPA: MgtC/SapB family protein [Egibacteraceae bacterium]|nr:MgtC/SapB family protein [Egibacteraceae bacterium]